MTLLQPISKRELPEVMALVARCFPTDFGYRWALPLCALPSEGSMAPHDLVMARQFVLKDERDAVLGTGGLYAREDDLSAANGFMALNWFCVDPSRHGQGWGRRLWRALLQEAARAGGRHLIFYSSTEPHHARAEKLYLRSGCARRLGPPLPNSEHRLTFFNLALGNHRPAERETIERIDASLTALFALDSNPALAARAPAAVWGEAVWAA